MSTGKSHAGLARRTDRRTLGGGSPLSAPGPERRATTLLGTRTFGDRVVELHYARSRD